MYAVGGAPPRPESATSSTTASTLPHALDTAAPGTPNERWAPSAREADAVAAATGGRLLDVLSPITGWRAAAGLQSPQGKRLDVVEAAAGCRLGTSPTNQRSAAGTRIDTQRGRSGMATPVEHKDAALDTAVLELRKIEPRPGVPQDREPWRNVPACSRQSDAERLAADHDLFLTTPRAEVPSVPPVKRGAKATEQHWQAMVKWQTEAHNRHAKQKAEEDAMKVKAEEALVQQNRKRIHPQRQGDLYTRLATTDRRGKPLKRGSTATRTTPYEQSMRRPGNTSGSRRRNAPVKQSKKKSARPAPDRPGTKPVGTSQTPSLVARLCDTRGYTGAHKLRFDESGKGRGMRGRRDSVVPVHDLAIYTRRGPHVAGQGQPNGSPSLTAADDAICAVVEEGYPPSPESSAPMSTGPSSSGSLPVFRMDTVVQELKTRQQHNPLAVERFATESVEGDSQHHEVKQTGDEENDQGTAQTHVGPVEQALDVLQLDMAVKFDNLLAAVSSIPDSGSEGVHAETATEPSNGAKLDRLLTTVNSIQNPALDTVAELEPEQEQEQELEPEPEPGDGSQEMPSVGLQLPTSTNLSRDEQQRKHIALEFLTTETTYRDGLQCLKVEWVDQLRFKSLQAAKSSPLGQVQQSQGPSHKQKRGSSIRRMSRGGDGANATAAHAAATASKTGHGFPDMRDIDKLFGNVESLLVLSEQLLSMLLERIGQHPIGSRWTPKQKLGDLFIILGPYFTSSYKQYVANFDDANTHIATMRATYPFFASTLDQLREVQGGLDLASYMVMPVQRLPRYRMLLEELIGKTPSQHEDYTDLTIALEIIKEATTAVNDAAREDRSSETEAETLRRELARVQLRNSQSQNHTRSHSHVAPDIAELTLLQKEKEDAEAQRRVVEQTNTMLAEALAAKDEELKAFRDSAAAATAVADTFEHQPHTSRGVEPAVKHTAVVHYQDGGSARTEEIKALWAEIDIDESGDLDREEVQAMLIKLGIAEDELDVDTAFAALDKDNDGTIDYCEFVNWYLQLGNAKDYTAETTVGMLLCGNLVESGVVTDETYLWVDGLGDEWLTYAEARELLPSADECRASMEAETASAADTLDETAHTLDALYVEHQQTTEK